MQSIRKILFGNYLKLQRHAFSSNSRSHSIFYDLDDLIRQRESFIEFIKVEYSIAIIFNILMSISTLIFLLPRVSFLFFFDKITTVWLILVSVIKLLEILPKIVLIYQTYRICNSNSDSIICSRRLMHMTRSNIFFYNTCLGYFLLILYTAFFLLIKRQSHCEGFTKFYYNVNMLIWTFCLRILVTFLNYHFYFKYDVNEADLANESLYIDYQNRVSPDIIEKIESHLLDKENLNKLIEQNADNERDVCCICMSSFCINDMIKVLPCNKKHVFHKLCVEKWLSTNKACPTCRKEVTMKSVTKIKMF